MCQLTVKKPTAKPYLTAGHRTYLIGGQDGSFPDKGEHIANEMYGIWSLPIKVCDGFWLNANDTWLSSPAAFSVLPYGAAFTYELEDEMTVERFQFIPDETEGVVISYRFCNHSTSEKKLHLRFVIKSELFPSWLSERSGKHDFEDMASFDEENKVIRFKDKGNPWYLLAGASRPISNVVIAQQSDAPQTVGKGIYGSMTLDITVKPQQEETLSFFLASSSDSREDALLQYQLISQNYQELLAKKKKRYQEIDERAALSLSGAPRLETLYQWTKYNNDWAVRDVKRIGKGVAAGYPEFPWWFGHDSTYLLKSFLLTGDYDLCRQTLRLIRQVSDRTNGNGRVVHEIAPNGEVYYEGMLTETPQFAAFIWHYYEWTGDKEFLLELYPFVKQGMDWVASQSVNSMPYGYGAAEYAGFDCIVFDCVVWTIRGYEVLSFMAKELGCEEDYQKYLLQFHECYEKFQKLFWLEKEQMYADMAGTKEEVIARAKAWRVSMSAFPLDDNHEYEGGENYSTDRTPQDALQKRRLQDNMDRIIAQAETMQVGEQRAFHFLGLAGVSLLWELGYLPQERADAAMAAISDPAYSLIGSSEYQYGNMPIGTARLTQQFAKQNKPDEIFNAIGFINESFGAVMPGATSEYHPDQGCFVQIWNNEATMTVYTACVFGLQVSAANKKISLSPCISEQFGDIRLTNVSIGDSLFDFAFEKDTRTVFVTLPSTEWTLTMEREEYGLCVINP